MATMFLLRMRCSMSCAVIRLLRTDRSITMVDVPDPAEMPTILLASAMTVLLRGADRQHEVHRDRAGQRSDVETEAGARKREVRVGRLRIRSRRIGAGTNDVVSVPVDERQFLRIAGQLHPVRRRGQRREGNDDRGAEVKAFQLDRNSRLRPENKARSGAI